MVVSKVGRFALVGGSICLLVLLCITFQNENSKYSLLNRGDDAIEHTQAAAGNKAALLKKMRSLLQVSISSALLAILIVLTLIILRYHLFAG